MSGIEFVPGQSPATVSLDGIGVPDPAEQALPPRNPLDSEENRKALDSMEAWWAEQVDAHAESRREQLTDCDFYDLEQWDQASIEVLRQRNQAPLVFDLIHPVVDWIVGTERRTRIDWSVLPRSAGAEQSAEAKTKLLKFVSDCTQAQFERSKQFKDAIISGVGWVREGAQVDKEDGIPLYLKHVSWKSVRWDPHSRADDLSDCRSMTIERYVDLDYAIALFPDRADALRAAASKMIDPGIELLTDDALMPQVFFGQRANYGRLGGTMSVARRSRPRVRMIETEYRRPTVDRRIRVLVDGYDELRDALYNPQDADQADLLRRQACTLDDRMTDRIWLAIWTPGTLCWHGPSPYKHNAFSLTPCWAFRRHRDGMPYGVVRGLRDPQEEYNKRRSKALFAASTNRVIYEAGALDGDDREEDILAEAAKPNAQIRLAEGALSEGRFKIEANTDIGAANLQLMQQARTDAFEASGVTRENLGLQTNAQSGRAILAKQQQGAVSTAELFDNYRASIQASGRKMLSLAEQYLTLPMQIRVVQDEGTDWLAINQPSYDPITGEVLWDNDITADAADFVVDQQDFRETTRIAMAEMLMETIGKMPPDMGIQLLDLAIDLTDIPNRAEFVQRIKEINGQGKKDQPPTPEDMAAQKAQQEDMALRMEERRAAALDKRASAAKKTAEAQRVGVETKEKALNVAGMLQAALPLAPAADRLVPPPNPRDGANA